MNQSLEAMRRSRARKAAKGEDTTELDRKIAAQSDVSPRVERAVMSQKISKRGH